MNLHLEVLKVKNAHELPVERLPPLLRDFWKEVHIKEIKQLYSHKYTQHGKLHFLPKLWKSLFFITAGLGLASDLCQMTEDSYTISLFTLVPETLDISEVIKKIKKELKRTLEESNQESHQREFEVESIKEIENERGNKEIICNAVLRKKKQRGAPGKAFPTYYAFSIKLTIKAICEELAEDLFQDPILYAEKCVEHLLELEKCVGIPDESGEHIIYFNIGGDHENMETIKTEINEFAVVDRKHYDEIFPRVISNKEFTSQKEFPNIAKLAERRKKSSKITYYNAHKAFCLLFHIAVKTRKSVKQEKQGIKETTRTLLSKILKKRNDLGEHIMKRPCLKEEQKLQIK